MHEPSITKTAFDCPHCGAYTTQYWHEAYIRFINKDKKIPFIPAEDIDQRVDSIPDWDDEQKQKFKERFHKIRAKVLFTDDASDYGDRPHCQDSCPLNGC